MVKKIKTIRKCLLPILLTAALTTLAFVMNAAYQRSLPIAELFSFRVTVGELTERIRPLDIGDGTLYVFLPSHAGISDVSVSAEDGLYLNGAPLRSGSLPEGAELNVPCLLELRRPHFTKRADLVFMQSANVSSLYVTTYGGTMEKVHRIKGREETVRLVLAAPDGTADYHTEGGATIRGHGNSTWTALPKKPYAVTLDAPAGLLGMEESDQWILLANGFDETNLRNKLCLDIASQLGLPYSVQGDYTDLYLNGEYVGLYLLTQKAAAVPAKDLAEDGSFLVEVFDTPRITRKDTYLWTNGGRVFRLRYPEILTESRRRDAEAALQRLEDAVLTAPDTLFECIDPSFVASVLFDEFTIRNDTDLYSTYFSYSAADGRFHGGPMWDYDIALGNNLAAKSSARCAAQLYGSTCPWYGKLYQNEAFYREMIAQYRSVVRPLFEKALEEDIPALERRIAAAGAMNSFRWDSMFAARYAIYSHDRTPEECAGQLRDFIRRRLDYLDAVWLDGQEMGYIELAESGGRLIAAPGFPVGTTVSTEDLVRELDAMWVNTESIAGWRDESTQEVFTSRTVSRENPRVTVLQEAKPHQSRVRRLLSGLFSDSHLTRLCSLGVIFAVFFLCMGLRSMGLRPPARRKKRNREGAVNGR